MLQILQLINVTDITKWHFRKTILEHMMKCDELRKSGILPNSPLLLQINKPSEILLIDALLKRYMKANKQKSANWID